MIHGAEAAAISYPAFFQVLEELTQTLTFRCLILKTVRSNLRSMTIVTCPGVRGSGEYVPSRTNR